MNAGVDILMQRDSGYFVHMCNVRYETLIFYALFFLFSFSFSAVWDTRVSYRRYECDRTAVLNVFNIRIYVLFSKFVSIPMQWEDGMIVGRDDQVHIHIAHISNMDI